MTKGKSILGDQEINWVGDNNLVIKTKNKKETKKVKKTDNTKAFQELTVLKTELEKSKGNLLNIQKSIQSKHISDAIISIELSLISLENLN